jgi:ribosomal protein S18 acetylase RimI-like enzyme
MKLSRLKKADLHQAAEIAAKTPLFRNYGMTSARARQLFRKALSRKDSEVWVARGSQGQVLGFAWLMKERAFGRSHYLRLIAVDADYHRLGVGARLMRTLEKRYLKPYGIFLLVTQSNRSAKRFYEKLGYLRVGRLNGYIHPKSDELIYFKSALR